MVMVAVLVGGRVTAREVIQDQVVLLQQNAWVGKREEEGGLMTSLHVRYR